MDAKEGSARMQRRLRHIEEGKFPHKHEIMGTLMRKDSSRPEEKIRVQSVFIVYSNCLKSSLKSSW